MTPAFSNSFRRLERSAGDIRGTPRRRSLNRLDPHRSSRITSTVQRVHRISAAIETGQNCPYPARSSMPPPRVMPWEDTSDQHSCQAWEPIGTRASLDARQDRRNSVQFLNLPAGPDYPNLGQTAKTAEGETRNVQSRKNEYCQTPKQAILWQRRACSAWSSPSAPPTPTRTTASLPRTTKP